MSLYTKPLPVPTNPYRHSPFRKAVADGIAASRRLGHAPDVMMPDVVVNSAITQCVGCGRYIVVDLEESREAYGSGVTEPCTVRTWHNKPWGMQ